MGGIIQYLPLFFCDWLILLNCPQGSQTFSVLISTLLGGWRLLTWPLGQHFRAAASVTCGQPSVAQPRGSARRGWQWDGMVREQFCSLLDSIYGLRV